MIEHSERVVSMKRVKPFYKSKKWLITASRIKRRDGYECQESKRYGSFQQAEVVHHIYPLEEYPELSLVSWNLISLSSKQHNRMHDRNTNEITEIGKQWQRRRKNEFDRWKKSKNDPPSFSKN